MENPIPEFFSVWMKRVLILYPLKNTSKESLKDFKKGFIRVGSKCRNVDLMTEKRKESIFLGIQMETKRLKAILAKESIRER